MHSITKVCKLALRGILVTTGVSLLVCYWSVTTLRAQDRTGSAHPLDPLNNAEIEVAVEVLRAAGKLTEDVFFPVIALREPEKKVVLAFEPGLPIRREASIVVLDRQANQTYESVVDLTERSLRFWKAVPNAHPAVLIDEYAVVGTIVRKDAKWQAAIRRRGITDFGQVYLDCWAPGHVVLPGSEDARLMRVLSFMKGTATNQYGRPIEGLVATVNLQTGKVVDLLDTGSLPVPTETFTDFFDPAVIGPPRAMPGGLTTIQKDGQGFQVRGHEITWQNWRFRYAIHPREGLVLYTVGYRENEKLRPILYRASVAEMVVPYADPSAAWNWRSAFDQGEYGLGRTCNSLQLGGDVPENAVLRDAVFANDRGAPYVHPAAVAIYEQDGGLLWKHFDPDSGKTAIRRARKLVISYTTTIGNYDYALDWTFHQDGSLEVGIHLTGILLGKGVVPQTCENCKELVAAKSEIEPKGDQRFGTLVDEAVVATNHQHLFNFRMDFDIDGTGNSVAETRVRGLPAGPENPLGNAFIHVEKPLRIESQARADLNLADHLRWKVFNPNVHNARGHLSGYLLEPGSNSVAYATPESLVRKRAGFINHHLWTTRYRNDESHSAGEYPRQQAVGEGLPQWSADESLENQDVVLWYTLGVTHIPRAEEWPVMPAAHAGFRLIPAGFFSRNPALDVPEEKN